MKGLMLAIFLGWAGGYRFYKKQKVLGFIYLFTLGIYFVGWIIDIIMASIEYANSKSLDVDYVSAAPAVPAEPSSVEYANLQLPKELPEDGLSFDCEIKGAFSTSKKDPTVKRADLVASIPVGSHLSIETAYYDGTPYFLVCVKGGLDIGSLPHELSRMIKYEYHDACLYAVLTDKKNPEHPKMRLTLYRG